MKIHYPDNLPISGYKEEIQEAIRSHQVIIVEGDTGSGKTTQLPKFCLELDPDSPRLIGCTQPRRVAAVSVAERVADELNHSGAETGQLVGYQIRFHDHTNRATRIKFMTDGILLAETRHDPLLKRYRVIIIDEAHERSLNIDFLLGYLKNLLPKRPDLKLIITSATIDTTIFSKHFGEAPILSIAGRTFPVEVRYVPHADLEAADDDSLLDHCVETIHELFRREGARDALIFLATERDIRICCALLEEKLPNALILPLFGRLQAADQRKIFQAAKQPKIIVATNVAETSITVPGIRYVIDSGLARISRYNVRSKITSLPITRISRASCDQRAGRCGRVGPGICIRLFSEEDYQERDHFTLPEIKRSNLAEVILRMHALGLGSAEAFPFVEPPAQNAIRDGQQLLSELGAVDLRNRLTKHGRLMSDLPMDPCISRIIIAGRDLGCLSEIKIIAAALAIQDPRVRPADQEQAADLAHARFRHDKSDFLVLLKIWELFHEVRDEVRSWNRLKKFCRSHFLSFQRMREWFDLHEQLGRILASHEGYHDNQEAASYVAVHQALCTGFLRNIAQKKKDLLYQGSSGRELMIFPGSHQFKSSGPWIVAATFLETSRLYALTVADIDPLWLEGLAGHLCRKSWTNPRWEKKSGQVIANEQVSLFGLIIVAGRKVNFGRSHPKNQAEARQIFIQSALLAGEMEGSFSFLKKNLTLVRAWEETEERLRTRDLLVDEQTLAAFYEQRLPATVYDRFTLSRFLKSQPLDCLVMQETDIINRSPEGRELSDFPAQINSGSMSFQLEYHFEPGSDTDGVTVRIPADLMDSVSESRFEWLVPGLLREKVHLLLKGLPKAIRKHLIPLNLTVDLLLDDLDQGKGSLLQGLERLIFKHFKRTVRRSDWPLDLPPHLQMRLLFFDQEGKMLAAGRSLTDLRQQFTSRPRATGQGTTLGPDELRTKEVWEKQLCKQWEFKDLPDQLCCRTEQGEISGYLFPALDPARDRGGVTIHFIPDRQEARRRTELGLQFLYQLEFSDQYRLLKKFCTTCLSAPSALWLIQAMGGRQEAGERILAHIFRQLFNTASGSVPGRELFNSTIASVRAGGLYGQGKFLCDTILQLLRLRAHILAEINRFSKLSGQSNPLFHEQAKCCLRELETLLSPDFLEAMSGQDLTHTQRSLQGLEIRIQRAYADPAKDQRKARDLQPWLERLQELKPADIECGEECRREQAHFRQLVNEYRLLLFAPEIKRAEQVSVKILKQQWTRLITVC